MKTLEKKPADKKFRHSIPLSKKLTEHRETRQTPGRSENTLIHRLIREKETRGKKRKQEKTLFLSIGLCLSLLLILGAFEWRTYTDESLVNMDNNTEHFESFIDIPQTEQVVPPVPKVEQLQLIEVADEVIIEQDIKLNLDVEITEETVIQEVIINIPANVEVEEKAEEIFTIVEQQPSPVGGMAAFYKYVGDNLKYPPMATRMNIQGRVFVQFVIEKDGSITDVQAIKGIGAGCDEEAVRVVSEAPNWEPGKQRGRPVRVRMILPIVFKLVM